MEPETLELFRQAYEEGILTCPKCGANLEVDADKCEVCGWENFLKGSLKEKPDFLTTF